MCVDRLRRKLFKCFSQNSFLKLLISSWEQTSLHLNPLEKTIPLEMNGSLESNLDQVGMWCLPLSSTLRNLDMQCWVAIIAIKIVIIASTIFPGWEKFGWLLDFPLSIGDCGKNFRKREKRVESTTAPTQVRRDCKNKRLVKYNKNSPNILSPELRQYRSEVEYKKPVASDAVQV